MRPLSTKQAVMASETKGGPGPTLRSSAKSRSDPRPPSVQSLSKQSALANDIYTHTHIHIHSLHVLESTNQQNWSSSELQSKK